MAFLFELNQKIAPVMKIDPLETMVKNAGIKPGDLVLIEFASKNSTKKAYVIGNAATIGYYQSHWEKWKNQVSGREDYPKKFSIVFNNKKETETEKNLRFVEGHVNSDTQVLLSGNMIAGTRGNISKVYKLTPTSTELTISTKKGDFTGKVEYYKSGKYLRIRGKDGVHEMPTSWEGVLTHGSELDIAGWKSGYGLKNIEVTEPKPKTDFYK